MCCICHSFLVRGEALQKIALRTTALHRCELGHDCTNYSFLTFVLHFSHKETWLWTIIQITLQLGIVVWSVLTSRLQLIFLLVYFLNIDILKYLDSESTRLMNMTEGFIQKACCQNSWNVFQLNFCLKILSWRIGKCTAFKGKLPCLLNIFTILPYFGKRKQVTKVTFLVKEQNVCHFHWHQWNITMSYLTYLLAGWVFMYRI